MSGPRCACDPCTLPRAHGGRCPSYDTEVGNGVVSSHCIPCAHVCLADEDPATLPASRRQHGRDCRCDGCEPPGPDLMRVVDPWAMPTREEAYEDALRTIADDLAVARRLGTDSIPALRVEAPLAALVALGYVPRPPAPGRRRLTSEVPD